MTDDSKAHSSTSGKTDASRSVHGYQLSLGCPSGTHQSKQAAVRKRARPTELQRAEKCPQPKVQRTTTTTSTTASANTAEEEAGDQPHLLFPGLPSFVGVAWTCNTWFPNSGSQCSLIQWDTGSLNNKQTADTVPPHSSCSDAFCQPGSEAGGVDTGIETQERHDGA
ncbi:hypothetical protein JZ751_020532 [Albula glossodonta]|uniref:Uncharacterized protein n=1 Tax=Albula glossodonta TaxID=121402 RepID=A0A8T2PIV9_9TELE|nr:hypothetical protein JZ751_020532 [Albula glossodonta]